jgi:glycosyltransferase involved in cell wall biosynthesis
MLNKRPSVYISIRGADHSTAGGSNTFAWNMSRYLIKKNIPLASSILNASHAIVIADKVNLTVLKIAKTMGCFILHRLDEDFVSPDALTLKHQKIIKINAYADTTIFQSNFVKDNLLQYLHPNNWSVIINGADPHIFKFHNQLGTYLGNITNSVGEKKRLDLLNQTIINYPDQSFLLIGNHHKTNVNLLKHPNVTAVGHVPKTELPQYHQRMKCLYFPSQRDPCPNTVVEAVISGVPVCYHPDGGTKEIVQDCGLPLERFDELLANLPLFHERCKNRQDLYFESVASNYMDQLNLRCD